LSFIQKAANTSPDARYPTASQVNMVVGPAQVGS
jgi:hypothetical protein